MHLLVTGTSGLLGLNLALEAGDKHRVTGASRTRLAGVPFELLVADLLDPGTVEGLLARVRPDWVVHCAALTNLEACEADPDRARRLNVELPGSLAAACAQSGARLVHLSTDAVFDGSQERPYTEEDTPHPLSVYARTKLEGESAVLQADERAIVVRVNFYGWSPNGKRSLGELFVDQLAAGRRFNGFTDVTICPTFVGDLAGLLLRMLERDLHGLYHAVGAQSMSKYAFGLAIARRFGLDERLVIPISVEEAGLTARRAHNLALDTHKLSTDLGGPVPAFSTGLDRFYAQYEQGYPQKIRTYPQP